MKGSEIIQAIGESIEAEAVNQEDVTSATMAAHIALLDIHSRVLACHAECLGMNAENMLAVCRNETAPYSDNIYKGVMVKWGLINEIGEPII